MTTKAQSRSECQLAFMDIGTGSTWRRGHHIASLDHQDEVLLRQSACRAIMLDVFVAFTRECSQQRRRASKGRSDGYICRGGGMPACARPGACSGEIRQVTCVGRAAEFKKERDKTEWD